MNGQVGTETIIVIGIVMVLFVVVLVYYSENERFLRDLKTPWDQEIECEKYAEILSSIYNKGHGTEWVGTVEKEVFVAESLVYLYEKSSTINEAVVCNHFARLHASYTATGEVIIANIGGKVAIIGSEVS